MRGAMKKGCKHYKVEIAAAGKGELEPQIAHHLESCPSCARFRAETLVLAQDVLIEQGPEGASEGASLHLARRAISDKRKSSLWIVPMLSASASLAALILFFGFGFAAEPSEVSAEAEEQRVSPYLTPSVPEAGEYSLPDSLEAINDLFLSRDGNEEGQI